MLQRGEPWGEEHTGAPDLVVHGDDQALALAAGRVPGATVRFVPDGSDLARAIGLSGPVVTSGEGGATALTLDALRVTDTSTGDPAPGLIVVNMVVLGVAPDELARRHRRVELEVEIDDRPPVRMAATTVVIANGQFLRGADLVPRGHPGDGRLEVQVYGLAPSARGAMRRRLTSGSHVPHPGVLERSGRRVRVTTPGALRLELDGRAAGTASGLGIELVPAAIRVLV